MPRTPKKPANLSDSLHRRLNSYALAASAAGVGVLALGQPVEGRVVYTPDHRYIALKHPVGLDLNGDGIVDFKIVRSAFTTNAYGLHEIVVSAFPLGQNRVAGTVHIEHTTYTSYPVLSAYALSAGKQIGSKLGFPPPGRNGSAQMAMRFPTGEGGYDC